MSSRDRAMGLFQKLFSRRTVSLKELKRALLEVERSRRRKQVELRKLEDRKGGLIEKLKEARRGGNRLEVDTHWEDLRRAKLESAMMRREVKVLDLETIGLKRYVFGIERLERMNDSGGVRKLIERVRKSGLDDKLAAGDIRERDYLEELEATLAAAGLDLEMAEAAGSDPEKEAFLAEIDAINAAEESGDRDAAVEREARLRSRLDAAEGEPSA